MKRAGEKKILITGASGLLGRALMKRFTGYDLVGTGFSRSRSPLVRLDLMDHEQIRRFIKELAPTVIIHAAAERKPEICEDHPERTYALNATATKLLSEAAHEVGAWMIYISTDYVFDGTAPPYNTHSQPNPVNIYGRSKLTGEKAALDHGATVLRLPLLYGKEERIGESPIGRLIELIKRGRRVKLDDWAVRFPTYVGDAAVVCWQMVEEKWKGGDMNGIWHWSAQQEFTKYTLAMEIASTLGCAADHILPDKNPAQDVPRPRNCQLDCSALEKLAIGQRTPFREVLEKILFK